MIILNDLLCLYSPVSKQSVCRQGEDLGSRLLLWRPNSPLKPIAINPPYTGHLYTYYVAATPQKKPPCFCRVAFTKKWTLAQGQQCIRRSGGHLLGNH